MEQALPIEELANQRLNVVVYSYTLFVKSLMEEGVDREKVMKASDKAWNIMGIQAGEQIRSLLGDTEKMAAIQQAGAIARSVHGIEANVESTEKEVRTEFLKCPWQEASEALSMPKEWRFCPRGHAAFAEKMLTTMYPDISYNLTKNMPMGDKVCEEISSF